MKEFQEQETRRKIHQGISLTKLVKTNDKKKIKSTLENKTHLIQRNKTSMTKEVSSTVKKQETKSLNTILYSSKNIFSKLKRK